MKTLTLTPIEHRDEQFQVATRRRMISIAFSLALGVFYLLSGFGKLLDVSTFAAVLQSYGIPAPLFYGAALLPPLEILLGTGLCLLIYNRPLAVVSAVLLVVFTVGFGYAHFVRGVQDCGCFGAISALKTSPTVSFLRNFALLAVSLYLWWRPVRQTTDAWHARKLVLLAGLGAVAFMLAGMSTFHPLSSDNELTAARYENLPVSQTPLGSLVPTSSDSTYLILAFSTTCPHCWNAMENVKAFQRTGTVDRVVGLTLGSDSALTAFRAMFEPNFETRLLQPDEFRPLTNLVPTAFFIRGNTIVHVTQEVESPFTFRQHDYFAPARP